MNYPIIQKTAILVSAFILSLNISAWGGVSFAGTDRKVISIVPEASTGLNGLYVLANTAGVTVTFDASSDQEVNWYKYSSMGGAYAQPVEVVRNGRSTSLPISDTADFGLIIEEGTRRYYYWVTNYANHQLRLESLTVAPEQDCATTALLFNGAADKITFYTINGAPVTLSRELDLEYFSLVYDSENKNYRETTVNNQLDYIGSEIHTPAPLCSTVFTLSGDRFLKEWNIEQSIHSSTFDTNAVAATAWAIQEERDADNEKRVETGNNLGGSAPAVINFGAATTDAVVFKEWQLSDDRDFNDITTRYNDSEITLTFNDQGTTYVRFMAANAAGTCDWYSDTYEVNIGESALECPNAFSPGNADGVNDEWKVSYKSIIEFECHIFNRAGIKMTSFTDPSQGWDGKYRGKLVPSGVYYYVIKAKGSDGKNYKLGGDINIINFKDNRIASDPDATLP